MIDTYDRQGRPITPEQWSRIFSDKNYQQLKTDRIDGIRVSTIWLGLDHGLMFSDQPPLIFESTIFGEPYENWMWRYSTEEDALRTHEVLVALLRAGEPIPQDFRAHAQT